MTAATSTPSQPAAALPMPIWLDAVDAHASPVAGRVAFVIDTSGRGERVVTSLRSLPGVSVPETPSHLFADGVNSLAGNYLTARDIGGGASALVGERPFLVALRALADAVYGSVLARTSADVVVDVSASSARAPQVITALYPDATVILIDDGDLDAPPFSLLSGPRICRLDNAALQAEPSALAARLAGVLADARAAVAATPPADGPELGEQTKPSAPAEGHVMLIVGSPRSGTTWLEGLLRTHPDLGGPARETAIFSSLSSLWRNAARSPGEGVAGWIDRRDLIAAMRRFCDALFGESLAAEPGSPTWFLEKTPSHGWHLELIAAVYPDARVISIHRDGRDVARSLAEVSFGTGDLAAAASSWARLTAQIEQTGASCPHFRDVRYEDLLDDPVGLVTDLVAWAGLAPAPGVAAAVAAKATERVSRYNTSGGVGAGKWKELPPADLRTIYRFAGDRLVTMGYLTPAELAAVRARPLYRLGDLSERLRRTVRRRAHDPDG